MELLDIYDSNGNATGRKIERGDKAAVLNENEHIAVAVIFIENDKGEFLIQKTSQEKGGEFSSTGGHVDSGETPMMAIKREVKEELGYNVDDEQIEEYGFILYDMPIRYLYYLKKNIPLDKIIIQQDEVEYVEYMSVSKINELIESNQMLKSHGIMFKELMSKRKVLKK
ncbi:MAG: NUDIX hydrolase [Bacilli bacterium]|nr:NUDIX hydrolase [Bacilli bacterium]